LPCLLTAIRALCSLADVFNHALRQQKTPASRTLPIQCAGEGKPRRESNPKAAARRLLNKY
jgi:hypothetical protein